MNDDALPAEPISIAGPRLGLLSDSHGDVAMTRAALEILLAQDAHAVIHLGDLCGDAVLEELAGLRTESGRDVAAYAIAGNMDEHPEDLARLGAAIGTPVLPQAGLFSHGETRVMAHHGHIHRIEKAAIARGVDYIIHGHTHVARDERIGEVRFINPGALHRARRYTTAVLNLSDGALEFFDVRRFIR